VHAAEWLPAEPAPIRTLQCTLRLPQQEASVRGAAARDSSWRSTSFFGMLSGKVVYRHL
jgi:hypothetical protein